MTTLVEPTSVHEPTAPADPLGIRVRRQALIAMPVLAGICLVIGAVADPAAGISGDRMFKLYAEHPGPLQIKSLAFHWAYAFWIGAAFVATGLVRRRGVWLANIAGVAAFAGMTTIPGLLFADWVDSATGQLWGVDGVNAMHDRVEAISWGFPYFQLPGLVGLALALPLAALALCRAGIVRWWAVVAVVAAFATFIGSNVTWPGCVASTAFLTVFSVALTRGTRDRAGQR